MKGRKQVRRRCEVKTNVIILIIAKMLIWDKKDLFTASDYEKKT